MAKKIDDKETVSAQELLRAQMIQIDAVTQLLIDEGIFIGEEFFARCKLNTRGKLEDMITKIISGGQAGARQAALDAAIGLGIPHGGWIPKGRKTERGILRENTSSRKCPLLVTRKELSRTSWPLTEH